MPGGTVGVGAGAVVVVHPVMMMTMMALVEGNHQVSEVVPRVKLTMIARKNWHFVKKISASGLNWKITSPAHVSFPRRRTKRFGRRRMTRLTRFDKHIKMKLTNCVRH